MKSSKDQLSFSSDLETWWEEEWQGMPEFVLKELSPVISIVVNFKTEKMFADFIKLVDQKMTDKTKSIWFPEVKNDELINLCYVDES